ncbi:MAG: asparaginase domain-containing protein [Candidatus Micrarchaeota archaeon]
MLIRNEAIGELPRKRIAVVIIGGTVFMRLKGETLEPGEIKLPLLRPQGKPAWCIDEFRPGNVEIQQHFLYNIDSSRIDVKRLNQLGKKLVQLSNDKTIDGVVVISGTDRMHKIVTRLAHHLHDLHKPVVFTGAQIELAKQGTDAKRNYENAVRTAWYLSVAKYPNVVLCFGRDRIEQGADVHHSLNALKLKSSELDAFDHPHKRVILQAHYDGNVRLTGWGKKLLGSKSLRALYRSKKERHEAPLTTFTPVREDLLDNIEVSETRSIQGIRISKTAQVIALRASGKGNVAKNVLETVAKRAGNRPVIVTTDAGADVDLAAYKPGREALQHGMLPSGGLIPVSAEIRGEYLGHEMAKIDNYVLRNCPRETDKNDFKRKLFAALYLSGAKFHGEATKRKHEDALGIKIPNFDLIINRPIEIALVRAHKEMLRKPQALPIPNKRKYRIAPQNAFKTDRLTRQIGKSPLPFKEKSLGVFSH